MKQCLWIGTPRQLGVANALDGWLAWPKLYGGRQQPIGGGGASRAEVQREWRIKS